VPDAKSRPAQFFCVPVFHCSTRVVRLSDVGQAFLRDCTELVGRFALLLHEFRTTCWMAPDAAISSRD